jgi:ethanolamine ammonia-lyase small subunit
MNPMDDKRLACASRDSWASLSRHTLGRSGSSVPTGELLRFSLAHARARDAVHTEFDQASIAASIQLQGFETLAVRSRSRSKAIYLRRPDLGRRLDEDSAGLLAQRSGRTCDLAIVVADGLSSAAIQAHAVPFLNVLGAGLRHAGFSLAPIVIASGARVALGDEVGHLLNARAVLVLIGERPGLSSSDSLGTYLTYDPVIGRMDSERNCISNIHHGGLSYDEASFKLLWLINEAFRVEETGIGLKDQSEGDLLAIGRQE